MERAESVIARRRARLSTVDMLEARRTTMSRSRFGGLVGWRRGIVVVALVCALAASGAASAAQTRVPGVAPAAPATPTPSASAAACGLGTLHGTYLYAGNGSDVSGSTVTPIAFAGSEVYSGTGQVSGSSTNSTGGSIKPRSPYTGTYTVATDCLGTLTIGTTLKFDIYVAPSGDSFTYIETNSGSVSAVTEFRVAPK
jgi:hypothetical protein